MSGELELWPTFVGGPFDLMPISAEMERKIRHGSAMIAPDPGAWPRRESDITYEPRVGPAGYIFVIARGLALFTTQVSVTPEMAENDSGRGWLKLSDAFRQRERDATVHAILQGAFEETPGAVWLGSRRTARTTPVIEIGGERREIVAYFVYEAFGVGRAPEEGATA